MLGAFFLLLFAACPSSTPQPNKPGTTEVARVPLAKAMQANAQGKLHYRQEHFEAAVQKYREATAIDPDMLSARLNLACGLSRLNRYAEATEFVVQLIQKNCIPWFREVFESADLAILRNTPFWKKVIRAQEESYRERGRQVREGVLFVARIRPPVHVKGEGTLVIRPHQEIFAYLPESGRYVQATAEDGGVLAFATTRKNYRFAYILGGKALRSAGAKPLLRGLSLRMVNTATMQPSASVPLPGDIETLSFVFSPSGIVELELVNGKQQRLKMQFDGERLETVDRLVTPAAIPKTVLTGDGVTANRLEVDTQHCPFTLIVKRAKTGEPAIQVHAKKQNPFFLSTSYGAGIWGLPFPTESTEPQIESISR
jgi:hypothetical protein